jgi:hypothetical protein
MKARAIALLLLTACGQTKGEPVGSITAAPAGGASAGGSGDGGGGQGAGGGSGQGGTGGAAGISGSSGQAGAGGSGQSGAAGGPPCPAPTPPSGGKCTQVGYPFLCDLFTGGCDAGSTCLFDSQDVEFECFLIPPESLASLSCGACDMGELGEPCAPGYHCHEGRCSRYCCDDGDCEQGACVPDTWLPAPLGVCAPKP